MMEQKDNMNVIEASVEREKKKKNYNKPMVEDIGNVNRVTKGLGGNQTDTNGDATLPISQN